MTVSIETFVKKIACLLKEQQLKLVTAESCTGGGLSFCLTSIPGSSDWFERGLVTYSNLAKIELLDVNLTTLEKEGAVSEATAREMAQGALKKTAADIAIAITGIAGPDGGTPSKPVGTVWIALARRHAATQTLHCLFAGDRHAIRVATIRAALNLLVQTI